MRELRKNCTNRHRHSQHQQASLTILLRRENRILISMRPHTIRKLRGRALARPSPSIFYRISAPVLGFTARRCPDDGWPDRSQFAKRHELFAQSRCRVVRGDVADEEEVDELEKKIDNGVNFLCVFASHQIFSNCSGRGG